MKRFILTACAGLLAAAVALPSFAADLPRPSYKSPVYSPDYYVAPFSWTGFYVGLNGGYGFGKSNWTNSNTAPAATLISKAGWSAAPLATTCRPASGSGASKPTSMPVGSRALAAAARLLRNPQQLASNRPRPHRLRLGSLAALPHRRRGLRRYQDDAVRPPPRSRKHKVGWTAGVGVEYAFMGAWSAKIEYLYADLGKATCGAVTCGLATDVTFKTSIVRVGVNYRF